MLLTTSSAPSTTPLFVYGVKLRLSHLSKQTWIAPTFSTGNELTPGVKYDFKFKDYAPWVFRHLRERFRVDAADYMV